MNEQTKGTTYRCTKEGCGVEVQVQQPCQSGEDCNLTCCGQKMQRQ